MRLLVLDTETTSICSRAAQIVGYSFAWAPGEACYIPVRVPAGEPQLDPELVRNALKPLLEKTTADMHNDRALATLRKLAADLEEGALPAKDARRHRLPWCSASGQRPRRLTASG